MESNLELMDREKLFSSIKTKLFEIAELTDKIDATIEISKKIGRICRELDFLV